MAKLALYGGEKTKTAPFGTGKRFGTEELAQLQEALEQNTLFYWMGAKVKGFCERFARMYGMKHCVAASSATAAIHIALGALGIGPGDEVITTPITDMGTLIGILYQNAIPVFADLQPRTYNMDPRSFEEKITDRTKAVIIVHLGGNPSDMDPLLAIARRHHLKVIEDCAQSFHGSYKGRLVGTMGDVGCFSLNDFKHISTGDGGMCIMNDEDLYLKAFRFADKNYDRFSKDPNGLRRIPTLAPNYRMTELQGAVALAQLDRLEGICARHTRYGDGITAGIRDLPGITPPEVFPGCSSTYWFYMFRVDEKACGIGRDDFSRALTAEGIGNSAGYIPCCVYDYDLFKNKNAHPGTACPYGCTQYYGKTIEYGEGQCPEAEAILRTAVKLPVSQFYTDQDRDDVVKAIRKVAQHFHEK
jgi:perosamine synthetase